MNFTQLATYLHPDLVPYVRRFWIVNVTMVVVLRYLTERAAAVNDLIAQSHNVVHSENNSCRDKQAERPK